MSATRPDRRERSRRRHGPVGFARKRQYRMEVRHLIQMFFDFLAFSIELQLYFGHFVYMNAIAINGYLYLALHDYMKDFTKPLTYNHILCEHCTSDICMFGWLTIQTRDPHPGEHVRTYVRAMSRGRPRASCLRQVEAYPRDTVMSGLASAWAMARRKPKEYHPKVDAATRCCGVSPHTWPDLTYRPWLQGYHNNSHC